VPTDTIRQQTLKTLEDVRHPNREALTEAFGHNVRVYDITEFTRLRPQDVTGAVNIFVATFAALRVEDKKNRKVYDYHEALAPCFRDIPKQPYFDETQYGYQTFRNLLAYIHPLVIIDEAHNHKSDLSMEVLERLRPSAVVELTATPANNPKKPANNSNVLYKVSASELKAEEMIKLPITLVEHQTWEDAAESAVQQRNRLEKLAAGEPDYIRPIALFQAENKDKDVTAETVREYLVNEAHIPEEQIAVATGEKHELDGVNLLARDCPIRYVITVQALKEGWDCPFAYVFCWLAQHTLPMDLTYNDLLEYVRRVVTWLQTTKGAPLSDLVRLRFKLEKLIAERIGTCREAAMKSGMQGALFGEDAAVRVTPDVAMAFGEAYPAKAFYRGAKRFSKHFYALIGDMNSEEEQCAQYIDANPNVETWVRNIEKEPLYSFWLPTHTDNFYPDFVAKRKDGVVCVIEYKGAHLATNDDTKEKDMVGTLWAKESGGLCRFLMATAKDGEGRGLAAQVREILE
ncbi:MAG: DEAD/DEAH box helicase family protein, partial [Schwartzia sp.]|nr:DEAD/DEAH box helicase family protein [Schwartzia sp. (in: firmicutes)]